MGEEELGSKVNEDDPQQSPSEPDVPAPSTHQVRIVSWNVNGLLPTLSFAKYHHGSLSAWLDSMDADIVCFQESKVSRAKNLSKELGIVEGWESFWATSTAKSGYSGCTTYVRKSVGTMKARTRALGEARFDDEGRLVVTDHGAFVLFNVYVPNSSDGKSRLPFKLAFLERLRELMEAEVAKQRAVVLIGDLNMLASKQDIHPKLYEEGDPHCGYDAAESEWMANIQHSFVDTYRARHPKQVTYTCWNQRTEARYRNQGLRIDYALVNKAAVGMVAASDVVQTPMKMSDHVALRLCLKLPRAMPCTSSPCKQSAAFYKEFKPQSKSLLSFFGSGAANKKKKKRESSNAARSTKPRIESKK